MKVLKRCTAILMGMLLLTLSIGTNTKAEVIKCPPNEKDMAKMMDSYINETSKQYFFSGSILVSKNGRVIFDKAYGKSDYENNIDNRTDTKFTVASITKQFVAAGIMILQEDNKLSVNDPISKYIPNYPNGDNITIHHLLTHTSGIPDYFTDKFALSKESKRHYTVDEIIELFKNKPVNFEPGKSFAYCNSNYALLGKIIQNVSGKSCENFLNDNIFKPLKMNNSGFYLDSADVNNKALGYRRTESGTEKCLNTDEYEDTSSAYVAGGMYSTVEDLYLWDKALNEGKLLKKESLDKIYTPYSTGMNYGYGVSIDKIHGSKCVSHSGGMAGVQTYIFRYIDEDICIVLLSNLPGAGLNQIEKNLFSIVHEGKYEHPIPFNNVSVSEDILDNYLGKYEFMPEVVFEITRDKEKVYIQEIGSLKNRVHPYSQNEFYYKTANQQIRFEEIKNGKAQVLILKYGDSEYRCKRVE